MEIAQIRQFLTRVPLLQPAKDDVLDELADQLTWLVLPGGWKLFEKGEKAKALYLVISGTLVVVETDSHGNETVLGFIRSGEPAGEMALIMGERRSASVYALRDTEVLRLSNLDFYRLFRKHASVGLGLSRLVLARLRERRRNERIAPPRVFSLIASSPSVPIDTIAKDLAAALIQLNKKVILLTENDIDGLQDFEQKERDHHVVLLATHIGDTPFYRFAARHSDRFLVFTRRDAYPSQPFPLTPGPNSPARRFRLVDLVCLNEGNQSGASAAQWLEATGASRLFRWHCPNDPPRLARVIAGESIGLVLSGGGARAYAHIGMIRALREAQIPIDFIGGTSMGAIIAAGVAQGWDNEAMVNNIRQAFVDSNPLGDHTIPVVALTKGKRIDERLDEFFGKVKIEDLDIPFYCVATEMVAGKARIFTTGSLKDALRATVALPGIVPPLVLGDEILVDGALMNNYPVDIMRQLHRGKVIGMDVARQGMLNTEDFIDPPAFSEWVVRNRFSSAPPIASLLIRAATLSSDRQSSTVTADLSITPELGNVEIRDWKNFDDVIEAGYQATVEALKNSRFGRFKRR